MNIINFFHAVSDIIFQYSFFWRCLWHHFFPVFLPATILKFTGRVEKILTGSISGSDMFLHARSFDLKIFLE